MNNKEVKDLSIDIDIDKLADFFATSQLSPDEILNLKILITIVNSSGERVEYTEEKFIIFLESIGLYTKN